MSEAEHQIVLTTCANEADANDIAERLVAEGLAAVVTIVPSVRSVYLLQGRPESATEFLLLIRAGAQRYAAIEARVRELHPYELPEIVAVPIVAGLTAYLDWVGHPE